MQEYIGSIDDPFIRKLEVTLKSFGWMTRAAEYIQSMKDTKLTDYRLLVQLVPPCNSHRFGLVSPYHIHH